MPNWISMELDVVGPPAVLDRFVAEAYAPGRNATFWFHRAGPPGKRDRHATDDNERAMTLLSVRTKTQARFSINAAWYFPERLFIRMARRWPALSFMCAVNHEDGSYGGLAARVGGRLLDLVRYTGDAAAVKRHEREVAVLQNRWQAAITARRPWVLFPRNVWKLGVMPFNATFDDDFMFYFRTRKEMAAFRKRYRVRGAAHRGKGGLVRLR